jgi:hypothetical protein
MKIPITKIFSLNDQIIFDHVTLSHYPLLIKIDKVAIFGLFQLKYTRLSNPPF